MLQQLQNQRIQRYSNSPLKILFNFIQPLTQFLLDSLFEKKIQDIQWSHLKIQELQTQLKMIYSNWLKNINNMLLTTKSYFQLQFQFEGFQNLQNFCTFNMYHDFVVILIHINKKDGQVGNLQSFQLPKMVQLRIRFKSIHVYSDNINMMILHMLSWLDEQRHRWRLDQIDN
ncbi:unnamed protein product [Paramecium sonneborni]|uniref:Uncharacterized protein n=1 Tax=Paramecium sonneborni TaxID=65129 RepID=A0A8S1P4E5_9CILI|nr:unnamed protein product [Paramecium sonneborni]